MIAPLVTPPPFESELKAISSMPMKITAKATKNSHVATEEWDMVDDAGRSAGLIFVRHSTQTQRTGSMQLLQTALPQPWHM
jgi:hypothetical protein